MKIRFIPCHPKDLKVGDFIRFLDEEFVVIYYEVASIGDNGIGKYVESTYGECEYFNFISELQRAIPVIDEEKLDKVIKEVFDKHSPNETFYPGIAVATFCDSSFPNAVKEIINKLIGA